MCGKVNYTNLSRYSNLTEKTYRRHYHRGIALEPLNQALIGEFSAPDSEQIIVVDCTFVQKSGRQTYGLDWFYNGKSQRPEKGLEWSVVSIVDVCQQTGYTLSAQQTEPGLAAKEQGKGKPKAKAKAKAKTTQDQTDKTRVDFYLGHLAYCQSYIPQQIHYVVADGFYSKYKWVKGVRDLGFHAIGKLRGDANLKFLYDGPQQPKGRHRRYGNKVNLSDISNLEWVADLEDGTKLYTALVWSVSLKRMLRLAYLLKQQDGKSSYVVLFSTDTELSALDILRFYQARFQIEFIFRDARQFTGLADCQSRNPEALDTHINVSLFALNLAKAAIRHQIPSNQPMAFSIASFKRLALNHHLLEKFIAAFELEPDWIYAQAAYADLLNYGGIAP